MHGGGVDRDGDTWNGDRVGMGIHGMGWDGDKVMGMGRG